MTRSRAVRIVLLVAVVTGSGTLAYALTFPVEGAALGVGPLGRVFDNPVRPDRLGNGGPASDLYLFDPMTLIRGPDGDIYLSDRGRGTRGRIIWRIDSLGVAHHVAGSGRRGRARDGQVAVEADLTSPEGMVFGPSGRLHFVDTGSDRVFRIEQDGTLTVVAGVGRAGFSGDGGPAREAALRNPVEIRLDAAGNFFVTDVFNHRIRRVDTAGIIETVVGTGEEGFLGEGTVATDAQLWDPWGIEIDPRTGWLLIADGANHRVRAVDADGRILTIVGTGEQGYSGDAGPAMAASLDTPQALAFDCSGRLYIGDEHNHVVRRVEEDGTIQTLVGTGVLGFERDIVGRSGTEVALNDPEGLLVRCDGSFLLADGDNGRVIEVDSTGMVVDVFGRGPTGFWVTLGRLLSD